MPISTHILKVNTNGQITLPSKYRKAWNIQANTKITVKIKANKTFSIVDIQNYGLEDLPKIIGKISFISDQKILNETKNSFQSE